MLDIRACIYSVHEWPFFRYLNFIELYTHTKMHMCAHNHTHTMQKIWLQIAKQNFNYLLQWSSTPDFILPYCDEDLLWTYWVGSTYSIFFWVYPLKFLQTLACLNKVCILYHILLSHIYHLLLASWYVWNLHDGFQDNIKVPWENRFWCQF